MMNESVLKKMHAFETPINELLALLFENTAADGTLYAPYPPPSPFALDDLLLCTRMDWDIHQFSQTAEDLYRLIETLKAMAPHCKALWEEGADPTDLLTDPFALQVYRTYCVPLDDGGYDHERLYDINDRLGTVRLVQRLRELQEEHEDMDNLYFIQEHEGVSVTEEEEAYSIAYGEHLVQCAKERVGDGAMAYDVYLRAQRLWRLYGMGAPHVICRLEARALAVAFVIHRHGTEPTAEPLNLEWDEE